MFSPWLDKEGGGWRFDPYSTMYSAPDGLPGMSLVTIAERDFVSVDQERFASICGDRNPMHMDALAARRTLAGFPVVHGIHVLLWGLDSLFRNTTDCRPVASIKVSFEKMIYVGDRVKAVLAQGDSRRLRLDMVVEGVRVVRLEVALGDPRSRSGSTLERTAASACRTTQPLVRADNDLPWASTLRFYPRRCPSHVSRRRQCVGRPQGGSASLLLISRRHGLSWSSFHLPGGNPRCHSAER